MLPRFLIIGAMKSGTTSLRAYLDAHPQAVCLREVHFFDQHFDRGVDWYAERFADVPDVPAVGEKTPEYMYQPEAIQRMSDTVPRARLIAVLRNPIDRAYSHFWHNHREGLETLSFSEALAAEADRLQTYPPGRCPFAYVDRGCYLDQLQRVCEVFPREQLLVLLFEDLTRDPAATFSEACRFLGIDDRVVPAVVGKRGNPYRTYRPRWLWSAMNRYRLWRLLPKRVAAGLGKAMERVDEYPPMAPGIRQFLTERFASDNQALAGWLGRDLSSWTHRTAAID